MHQDDQSSARAMTGTRPLFSICIPSYNRARHLRALLDSILSQSERDYEVLICEDQSPERQQIRAIVESYQQAHPEKIRYHENAVNLGYDRNIRELVALASGHYCFFMGNDDVMCPDALSHVSQLLNRHPEVGLVLKSYAWFDETPQDISQEVHYFDHERVLAAGKEAVTVCFRRSGVISGYVVHRDEAQLAATDAFDGTLYYQLHLTACVLADRPAVATPEVLVLCRASEPPEFGNSASERGRYIPGAYTPDARYRMVRGAIDIIERLDAARGTNFTPDVMRDYANYFYPYIRDQLNLPPRDYYRLYRRFATIGFDRYPLFHIYFVIAYLLGARHFDTLTRFVRTRLGRSPDFMRRSNA